MRRARTVLFQINLFDQMLSGGSMRAAGSSEGLEQTGTTVVLRPGLSPTRLKTMETLTSPAAYF